eukprot:TRINITY_DN27271_c0_g1_i1.p1 TRINITY_DN27271_c0_g1~~TRINITY_DN27271_c0_g1_i1.p1  ORF type:complete len:851 (+),score=165.19 TRINITY_DN27271_c0_g1_i1:264-2555(+)
MEADKGGKPGNRADDTDASSETEDTSQTGTFDVKSSSKTGDSKPLETAEQDCQRHSALCKPPDTAREQDSQRNSALGEPPCTASPAAVFHERQEGACEEHVDDGHGRSAPCKLPDTASLAADFHTRQEMACEEQVDDKDRSRQLGGGGETADDQVVCAQMCGRQKTEDAVASCPANEKLDGTRSEPGNDTLHLPCHIHEPQHGSHSEPGDDNQVDQPRDGECGEQEKRDSAPGMDTAPSCQTAARHDGACREPLGNQLSCQQHEGNDDTCRETQIDRGHCSEPENGTALEAGCRLPGNDTDQRPLPSSEQNDSPQDHKRQENACDDPGIDAATSCPLHGRLDGVGSDSQDLGPSFEEEDLGETSRLQEAARRTLRQLEERRIHRAPAPMTGCLEEGGVEVRAAAMSLLAQAAQGDDRPWGDVLWALSQVADKGDSWSLAAVLECLDHAEWHVRREAVAALARIAEPGCSRRILAALIRRLDDNDAGVRRAAAAAMPQVACRGDERALRALGQHCLGDPELEVRQASVSSLGQLVERGSELGLDLVMSILKDSAAWHLQLAALWMLLEITKQGDARPINAAVRCLSAGDERVRHGAGEVLCKLVDKGDEHIVRQLLDLMDRGDADIQKSTMKALSRIARTGDQRVIGSFVKCLKGGHWSVRQEAVWALVEVADQSHSEAKAALAGCDDDDEEGVRIAAHCALDRLKPPPDAPPALPCSARPSTFFLPRERSTASPFFAAAQNRENRLKKKAAAAAAQKKVYSVC